MSSGSKHNTKGVQENDQHTRASVNTLISALQQWESSNPHTDFLTTEAFWSNKVFKNNRTKATQKAMSESAHILQALSSGIPPIVGASKSAAGPSHATNAVSPFRRKDIMALSDEILAAIFALAYDFTTPKSNLGLFQVCRRISTILLTIPKFWTHVSNYQPLAKVTECLTRSKDEGITIHLLANKGDGQKECQKFFDALVPHIGRWRALTFKATEHRGSFFSTLSTLLGKKGKAQVTLPALESFRALCYNPEWTKQFGLETGKTEWALKADWAVLYFWQQWKMPNLTDVALATITKEIRSGSQSLGSALTALDLHYHAISWDKNDCSIFMAFPGQFKKLRELSLTFHDIKKDYGSGSSEKSFKLSHLQCLSIRYTEFAVRKAKQLISFHDDECGSLNMSGVTWFSLIVNSIMEEAVCDLIQSIKVGNMRKLKGIYLSFPSLGSHIMLHFPKLADLGDEADDEIESGDESDIDEEDNKASWNEQNDVSKEVTNGVWKQAVNDDDNDSIVPPLWISRFITSQASQAMQDIYLEDIVEEEENSDDYGGSDEVMDLGKRIAKDRAARQALKELGWYRRLWRNYCPNDFPKHGKRNKHNYGHDRKGKRVIYAVSEESDSDENIERYRDCY